MPPFFFLFIFLPNFCFGSSNLIYGYGSNIFLHKLFDNLNQEFFQNELPECIITVQAKGNTGAYGWFTPSKVWNVDKENKHEINITAESLRHEYIDIANTMLHEMIHLYCNTNNIKDVSRGNSYHNSRFKEESIKHGFYYEEN